MGNVAFADELIDEINLSEEEPEEDPDLDEDEDLDDDEDDEAEDDHEGIQPDEMPAE
jgi:hypothetical protein